MALQVRCIGKIKKWERKKLGTAYQDRLLNWTDA